MKVFAAGVVCLTLFTAHAIDIRSHVDATKDQHVQPQLAAAKGTQHGHAHGKLAHKDASPKYSTVHEMQHEVEEMVTRVHRLNDPETTVEFAKELGGIEATLSKEGEGEGDHRIINEIAIVRAELCEEAGFENTEYDDCKEFMLSQCSPNSGAASMQQPVVSRAHCTSFFAAEEHAAAPGAAAPVAAAPSAPSPTAWAPPAGAILNGKGPRPLPAQGYHGDLIEHKDTETETGDWRLEFGPKANHRSFRDICADHEGNEWCRIHGYFKKEQKEQFSGTPALRGFGMMTVLLAAGALLQW